jgi:hypothetical protein
LHDVSPQGVHCIMCTCKMVVERVSIEAFFYHIGRRKVNWRLLYRHPPPWRKGCVCTFSFNHLTFNKVKSWWPRVSQLFLCVHINKFPWIYYVHKQFISSLSISNTILWKHQMPYMSIVNRNTPIMRLNLEDIIGHKITLLTIKGHQTSYWRQIGKSM